MTDAAIDQEHIDMIICSRPSIPDRTDYILGKSSNNPVIPMVETGKALISMGVDYIAIPCITAHYFYSKLADSISVPIIHIVKETVKHLSEHGVRCAGVMATEGTVFSGLFQEELLAHGIKPITPSHEIQGLITDIIYKEVKANKPVNMDNFGKITKELKSQGADVIILGCTELSLIKRDYDIGIGFIDAMEVLAMQSLRLCNAKLKEEYQSLIT